MAVVPQKERATGRPLRSQTAEKKPSLKALIIGGKGISDRAPGILNALSPMNVDIHLVGVAHVRNAPGPEGLETPSRIPVVSNYRKFLREHPPDMVIVASRDRRLLREILTIVPAKTRIFDALALETFESLKKVTGQLGTAEKKLHTVEMVKQVLMAGTEVSTMVIDETFRVIDINNVILRRTRMPLKGCLGSPCHWVIHRNLEPCFRTGGVCPAKKVFRTGHPAHSVREDRREGMSSRYYTVSAYPLPEDEQGKKCVIMVWKDVTTGMAHVLDRQARDLQQNFSSILHQDRLTALGKLAAAAVHDINNPIQGILTFAKLMSEALEKNTITFEEVRRFKTYLDLIATESSRCGQILKSLLSFASLGTLEWSAVFLGPMLDEVLLLVGNRLELQGITLERVIPDSLPPVHGDRNQIKQVLLNLVLNAVEAMPGGGGITVSARMSTLPDNVRITLTDTGPGIPKELQPHVLEPFVTTKEFGKGVGLGLSVVYGIVTQHGGSLEVQSEEGRGSVFSVTLPAYRTKSPGNDDTAQI
jgi:two-component system, NtrC family, sensor kinase